MNISPISGLLVMFPSYLLHTVYPFIGEGERRSVSLNARHSFVTHKENRVIQKDIELPKFKYKYRGKRDE